jgi:hypothetical protein
MPTSAPRCVTPSAPLALPSRHLRRRRVHRQRRPLNHVLPCRAIPSSDTARYTAHRTLGSRQYRASPTRRSGHLPAYASTPPQAVASRRCYPTTVRSQVQPYDGLWNTDQSIVRSGRSADRPVAQLVGPRLYSIFTSSPVCKAPAEVTAAYTPAHGDIVPPASRRL